MINNRKNWKGGLQIRCDVDDALSAKQRIFVSMYVANGANSAEAAREAGLPPHHKELDNHLVRQAIELRRDLHIKTAGATQAWAVMQTLMADPGSPAQVRFQAARWTLEASGHGLAAIAAALHMGRSSDKDQHEMSVSELQELVDKARTKLVAMRNPVIDLDQPSPPE